MTNTDRSSSEVLNKFADLVSKSLHIEPALVTPDTYLDDLGAESLDLIEITMETESQFDVWLPEKSILDTAVEVFGPGVLEKDGFLTEAGKRMMQRRMPPEDAAQFEGEIAVRALKHYFLKVDTWLRMIESLLEHTPRNCASCGGPVKASLGLKMKCSNCGVEVSLRSGEDINRDWVKSYYEECRGQLEAGLQTTSESEAARCAAQ